MKSTHLESDKLIVETVDETDVANIENLVETTYAPSKRSFANRHCEGQSFEEEYVVTTTGIIPSSDSHKVSQAVKSVNEKRTVSAGTFTTVRIEKIDNGHIFTIWLDIQTGVAVYMEGEGYSMELMSFEIPE